MKTKPLTMFDVKLIRDCAERWDYLSQHHEAYECATDHCHTELDDLISLADKIEAGLEENQ